MEKGPILLTGATGFIGTHLATALAAAGYQLRYLLRADADTTSLPAHEAEQIFIGDLLDTASLEAALEGCVAVVHAAAKVSFLPAEHKEMWAVNQEGTAHLVNAALHQQVGRFVHISSVAALNRESGKMTTLADRWQETAAPTVYGQTKFAAEREVWRGQAEGLSVAVLYPSTVIGPGNWHRPGTPRLFHRARGGMRLAPTGTAGFVAVEDVVEAALFALQDPTDGLRMLLNAENLAWPDALTQIAQAVEARPPAYQLAPWAAGLLWPVSTLAGVIRGKPPRISRDLYRTASANYSYDGSSYTQLTGKAYHSVAQAILNTGAAYLGEMGV